VASCRTGYSDVVKQEGPLPRIKDDTARIVQKAMIKPNNQWAPAKALAGQNDYIGEPVQGLG
jgi:hypothetical protein